MLGIVNLDCPKNSSNITSLGELNVLASVSLEVKDFSLGPVTPNSFNLPGNPAVCS